MLFPSRTRRGRRTGLALAIGLACVAAPVAAQASAIDLGTAKPFVVLAGSTATNTGPSVLNGDLGVYPGTGFPGFGPPAVVNGATHIADAVAGKAKDDLGTAYDVAAGQATSADLSNTDLGNRSLNPGAYKYTSNAQLTGPLTLNAQGDPNAQFVFQIATSLNTASGSSVLLINGASPCNVYWQIGSSATLGTTTAFQGNIMALASISLANGATIIGRALARNGAVTLDNNVLDNSGCTGTTTGTPGGSGKTGPLGTPATPAQIAAAAAAKLAAQAAQRTNAKSTTTRNGTTTLQRTPHATCTSGFRATVRGKLIKRVTFSLDGKKIQSQTKGPYVVFVRALPGAHNVKAHVTFKDATRAKTLALGYRACADAILRPTAGPSQFTG